MVLVLGTVSVAFIVTIAATIDWLRRKP